MKEQEKVMTPSFREKHSIAIRIWHWCTFITIAGSLLTVLLAKTVLNKEDNTILVQQNLQASNVTVTTSVARQVAHEFSDKAWNLHKYFGYILASLLLFRLIIEFFQPGERKLLPLIKKSVKYLKQPDSNKPLAKHYLFTKYVYLIFYISLLIQASTGLFMAYSDDIETLKSLRHTASDIHSVFMWVLISYIIIHIGGVILAEIGGEYKGIVSDMLNGGE